MLHFHRWFLHEAIEYLIMEFDVLRIFRHEYINEVPVKIHYE